MRTAIVTSLLVAVAAVPQVSACSSSSTPNAPTSFAAVALEATCTDAVAAVYGDPGTLGAVDATSRGTILKCAKDTDLTAADVQAKATAAGYVGKAATSGASVFRVVYETQRATDPVSVGYSSALVLLPTNPIAQKVPLVVASHGSRGQAAACAPSKNDPSAADVEPDFEALIYPEVGAGFAVIAPDLAGYANYGAAGNPPDAYSDAADVGMSTLDGARALAKLIPSRASDKVVLTGHSQGGGTTLAALSMIDTYGSDLNVVAAATFAPLWLNQAAWGAITLSIEAPQFPFTTQPGPNAVSIWYHYSEGELHDGPGHGLDVFKAEKRDGIKAFVESACWSASYPSLEALGANADDVFDPAFVSAVAVSAALGSACGTDATAGALCQKWVARYAKDRPHLTGKAAQVPLLVAYGAKDATIAPGRMKCVLDRLDTDTAAYKTCVDPDADHSGIVKTRAEYVNAWLVAKTTGSAAPADCAAPPDGTFPGCTTPPPND